MKAIKIWQKGTVLSAMIGAEEVFPLVIPFKKISAAELTTNYAQVSQTLSALRRQSKEQKGYGYSLEFVSKKHQQLGEQQTPAAIYFVNQTDYLRYLGKEEEFDRFATLSRQTVSQYPTLTAWLKRYPFKLLKHQHCWPQMLAVCAFFLRNSKPQRYLRELEIVGVDSKFIEQHKGIIRDLLDQVLPERAIEQHITSLAGHGFEQRYGLLYDQPLIRFRILDEAHYLFHLSDISIPIQQIQQFATLNLSVQTIFITENKTNGLVFPAVANALVIFGLGYGVQSLKNSRWLQDKTIYYWGDLDTHGFSILAQLRSYFPHTRSFLMDKETLLLHKSLWVKELDDKRCVAQLNYLYPEEQQLYQALQENDLGHNIRLEQERITFSLVEKKLTDLEFVVESGG
ncbi:MAG: hypothetical protein JRG71_06360 [Deltaproteobacteria bacterium]|nr:hypothetical protein [Deltaproteobacteria bacterium]